MPPASLILPFAVPAKERIKAFTPSMEVAAILLLTQAKHGRQGLFKATPNKTPCVSKLHYPLWAVPWENESLIIDGLGAFSSTIAFQILPNYTQFLDDVDRGSSVRGQFRVALEKYEKTFKDFAKLSEFQINAVIMGEELLSAVHEYVKETLSRDLKENDTAVLAPPRLDLQAAVESAKQVSHLHKQIQSEMRGLEYARNLLDGTEKYHEQMILKEVEITHEAYETEISKLRPEIDEKVNQLLKERDTRIAKMSRIAENELKPREKESERLGRELQRLEFNRVDYLTRRQARKRRHDKIGETHWDHRIRAVENKIEELKARTRALSEFIEKTRRQNETDGEKLKYGYQALIDQEKKKIRDIEVQRDGNVEAKRREIENLRLATSRILGQVEELMTQKRGSEEELEKLTIPWQLEDVTLLCLPFYIVRYQAEKKTKFQIFPPFKVMSSEGILKALQKTLRSLRPTSRVNLFLQPRSKALGKMLDFVFLEKMKSDKAFNESLLQTAASANVLDRQNFKELLARGVEELKAEGWISQKQGVTLIKAYA